MEKTALSRNRNVVIFYSTLKMFLLSKENHNTLMLLVLKSLVQIFPGFISFIIYFIQKSYVQISKFIG